MDYDPRMMPRSSVRWRPTHMEDALTTRASKRESRNHEGLSAEFTLCGMIQRGAYSHLPNLPDQGSLTNLWILVSIWMGASTLFTGKPRKTASQVLSWIRDILDFQVRHPSEWKGLGDFSSPLSDTLVEEFGPVAFVQAILACTMFYLVLNNHDLDLLRLDPLVRECEQLMGFWRAKAQ